MDAPGPPEPQEHQSLCSYVLVDSRDQLSINLTPHAMDVITEVSQVKPNFMCVDVLIDHI